MKRITASLTDEQYDELWAEHVKTRQPLSVILVAKAFKPAEAHLTRVRDSVVTRAELFKRRTQ